MGHIGFGRARDDVETCSSRYERIGDSHAFGGTRAKLLQNGREQSKTIALTCSRSCPARQDRIEDSGTS